MVCVSKSAIQCPSPSCDFAYFASSPDPAGKLRNHFNNLKVRDAEHESFFQKPFCVFCGNPILSKTRKGLWKSGMNKHWLLNHSVEFAEVKERQDNEGMKIAVMLSPLQLDKLANESQLEYELEEGDLISRKEKATHLSRGIVIARTPKKDPMPSLKRRRTSHEQIKSAEAFDSVETGPNHPGTEVSGAVARSCKRYMTQRSLVSDELHFATPLSSKTQRCDECEVFGDKPAAAPTVPSLSRADPFQNAPPPIESYPADAFTAITFCFPGFDDDMEDLFENSS